jgi:hypothetical protein
MRECGGLANRQTGRRENIDGGLDGCIGPTTPNRATGENVARWTPNPVSESLADSRRRRKSAVTFATGSLNVSPARGKGTARIHTESTSPQLLDDTLLYLGNSADPRNGLNRVDRNAPENVKAASLGKLMVI